jgi:hypothetical protein
MSAEGDDDYDVGPGGGTWQQEVDVDLTADEPEPEAQQQQGRSEVAAEKGFLWQESDLPAGCGTVDRTFTGGIYDYFVVVRRGEQQQLAGHLLLAPLKDYNLKGYRFEKNGNGNLFTQLRRLAQTCPAAAAAAAKIDKEKEDKKPPAAKKPVPVPAATALDHFLKKANEDKADKEQV